jgi:hypothetical protein
VHRKRESESRDDMGGMDLPSTVIAHCRLSVVEQDTVIVDRVLSSYAGFRGEARHGEPVEE